MRRSSRPRSNGRSGKRVILQPGRRSPHLSAGSTTMPAKPPRDRARHREGADIVMVKPAMSYLDVVRAAADISPVPVPRTRSPVEYSMICAAGRPTAGSTCSLRLESLIRYPTCGCRIRADLLGGRRRLVAGVSEPTGGAPKDLPEDIAPASGCGWPPCRAGDRYVVDMWRARRRRNRGSVYAISGYSSSSSPRSS